MKGRKPKPTQFKVLTGNPGQRRLNDREPKPKPKLPPCPDRLTGAAREAWLRFSKPLAECGIATKIDATALEMLCDQYATYVDCMEKVRASGVIWVANERDERGLPVFRYSPFLKAANEALASVTRLLTEFGMTPSSRSRVRANEASTPREELDEFLEQA